MGESLNSCLDNDVNGTGAFSEGASPGRCPVSSTDPVVIMLLLGIVWSKEINKVVTECYLKSKPVNENGAPI